MSKPVMNSIDGRNFFVGTDFVYEVHGEEYVTIWYLLERVTISRPGILKAIENVKSQRAFYLTEKAYQRQLTKYTKALEFIDENGGTA